jgi:hypothetical protein
MINPTTVEYNTQYLTTCNELIAFEKAENEDEIIICVYDQNTTCNGIINIKKDTFEEVAKYAFYLGFDADFTNC